MFDPIPWVAFAGDNVHFWIHYGLVIIGFILAVITVIVQWVKPAPYGKHADQENNWGPPIPQQLGHIFSDAVPGVMLFGLIFFLLGDQLEAVNLVLFILFELHYIHRGIIFPLMMKYSSPTVAIGITLGGFFPNCLFHGINADFIGSAQYANNYYYDPRFLLGILLFIFGYIINRHSDWKLRNLRNQSNRASMITENQDRSPQGYYIPYGGLFEVITCPNYFGELVQWIGWSLATWSLAGLVWCLFSAATFFPRARHNHQWYKQQFELYPPHRKALIPFLF